MRSPEILHREICDRLDKIIQLLSTAKNKEVREWNCQAIGEALEMKKSILERLQGYNLPDRTIDDQRQIAQDIHDAVVHIKELETKIVCLEKAPNSLPALGSLPPINPLTTKEYVLSGGTLDNPTAPEWRFPGNTLTAEKEEVK